MVVTESVEKSGRVCELKKFLRSAEDAGVSFFKTTGEVISGISLVTDVAIVTGGGIEYAGVTMGNQELQMIGGVVMLSGILGEWRT